MAASFTGIDGNPTLKRGQPHKTTVKKGHPRTAKSARQAGGRLILLNKPFGYVSQFSGADKNLSNLVTESNVYPAGRLDKDSEGLLLLTDNGVLQHKIAHPSQKLRKTYWVQVEGIVRSEALDNLRNGVRLKDGLATAIEVCKIEQPASLWPRDPPIRHRQTIPTEWIQLVIDEGRNRQVRRMTAVVNLPTLRLIRSQIGKWTVDEIVCGESKTIPFDTIDELLLN